MKTLIGAADPEPQPQPVWTVTVTAATNTTTATWPLLNTTGTVVANWANICPNWMWPSMGAAGAH